LTLQDAISDPSASDAEIYMAMLKEAFDIALSVGSLKTADDVRKWWRREAKRRDRYQLNQEQEDEIVEICKTAISLLPETKPEYRNPAERRPRRNR